MQPISGRKIQIKPLLPLLFSAALLLGTNAQAAGDVVAGEKKSAVCAACHGANGISPNPDWPNLAGQKAAYLVKQITAFKTGERTSPLMSPQASMLSDQDIQNLAAYFNQL